MIETFADRETERIYRGLYSKNFPRDIQRRVLNKLRVLNAVLKIEELLSPPSNRLEALKGGRAGQFSIRVNDQWRICFRWRDGNAHDVHLTDYH